MYKTINLSLPMLHEGQKKIVSTSKRFNVLSCGRRFGKTTMGGVLGSETAIDGHPVGWFAPDYKLLDPAFSELQMLLQPITSRVDRIMKVIHLITGGSIDFWSLKNNDSAGRGRKYKRVIIDEASYADRLKSAWEMAIRPTLFDLKGDAWFFSSPTSGHYFNVLYNKGQRSDLLWKSWRANSADNPYMSKEEMEEQARDMDERTRLQEMHGIPTDAENQYFTGASIDRQRELYQCDPQVCRYDEVNRRFRLDPSGPWCIWGDIQPAEDANYVIGIDASYGIGRSNSVISVFNAKTREQVAEYASPGVSPFDLADLAMSVGKHPFKGRFGSAYIVWEEAGGGKGMYKQFIRGDRNYPLLYSSKIEGKRNERKTRRMGWVPTHSSKKIRMGCFRAAFENVEIKIRSESGLDEMVGFIIDDRDRIISTEARDEFSGAEAAHGDRAITYMLALMGIEEAPPVFHKEDRRPKKGTMGHIRYKMDRMDEEEKEYDPRDCLAGINLRRL